MVFGWLRKYKRRRILAKPFPSVWESVLAMNAGFLESLSDKQLVKILQAIQIIVAEKHWEGCGGLVLTDEHRVTIAAQMARMTLHFESEFFDAVLSILIYPGPYLANSQSQMSGGVIVEEKSGRLGEAWHRGPVILSWSEVLENVRDPNPHRNVVIHEFAHQLDMRNGSQADGVPTLESASIANKWTSLMSAAYEELGRKCQQHVPTILDCYGATSPAEFFAVASESYFEQPVELERQWPLVFEMLDGFYRNRLA